jgi:peptide/nickel transport system substrate-binding protein
MAYLNIGVGAQVFRSIQTSLAQVGIVVAPKRFDSYTKFILLTRNVEALANEDISLVVSGAQSIIGSPSDYWADFVDSRLIKPFGNQNLAVVDDPKINTNLDSMISTPERAAVLSAQINSIVMKSAVYLPYAHDRILMYRNPNVRGIYIQQSLDGQYDIVNVGISAN